MFLIYNVSSNHHKGFTLNKSDTWVIISFLIGILLIVTGLFVEFTTNDTAFGLANIVFGLLIFSDIRTDGLAKRVKDLEDKVNKE